MKRYTSYIEDRAWGWRGQSHSGRSPSWGWRGRSPSGFSSSFIALDSLVLFYLSSRILSSSLMSDVSLLKGGGTAEPVTTPKSFSVPIHVRVLSEFLATTGFFTIVFGVAVNCARAGYSTEMSTLIESFAMAFGAAVLVGLFGNISGAHFNPILTAVSMSLGRVTLWTGILYMIAQLLGSLLSIGFVALVFPDPGASMKIITLTPSPSVLDSTHSYNIVFMEALLSFILCVVVVLIATNSRFYRASGFSGSIPILTGFTFFCLHSIGSSVSGAAFNPLRVFWPAVFSNHWDAQYWYYIGQLLGAVIAYVILMCWKVTGVVNVAQAPPSFWGIFSTKRRSRAGKSKSPRRNVDEDEEGEEQSRVGQDVNTLSD
jgi:aquaporin TIP